MAILSALKGIFGGSGVIKSLENIATEWIQTDTERAEAKVLMVKALDPNGKMRRDLSNTVARLYSIYMFVALSLLVLEFFGWVPAGANPAVVTAKVTELFLPVTGLFGAIVTASFGVNYANVTKEGR